jgi:hypothetical protein
MNTSSESLSIFLNDLSIDSRPTEQTKSRSGGYRFPSPVVASTATVDETNRCAVPRGRRIQNNENNSETPISSSTCGVMMACCTDTSVRSDSPLIDTSFMGGCSTASSTQTMHTADRTIDKRKCNRFKRFVEARQNERAKKFYTSFESIDMPGRTRSNGSPKSIMEDISVGSEKRSDATYALSFTIVEPDNVKGSVHQTTSKQTKNPTRRNEGATDAYTPGEDDETVGTEDSPTPLFGRSRCQADNFKDLYEDCRDQFKTTLNDIREEARRIGKGVTQHSFRDNLASFNEEINEDKKECSMLSKQIMEALASCAVIEPTVCQYDDDAESVSHR